MKDNNYERKIPTIAFPSIQNFEIKNIDEDIVSLKQLGLKVSSAYYNQGIAGAYKDVYLRKTPAEMLLKAQENLPNGIYLYIYDGYRPICIQQRLWNFYRQKLKIKFPDISNEELDFKTSFFISKPSYDITHPSLHNTGGAVDLTLVDEYGNKLNMGTEFDDFTNKAWTNYYEEYEANEDIRNNRRMLYWAMIDAGFTNLPSEWWHYDYGTKFWAYFKNEIALYEGILDIDLPNRIPII